MLKLARIAAVVSVVGIGLGFGLNAAYAAPALPAGLSGSTWTIHYTWTGAYPGTFSVTLNANHTATSTTGLPLKWSTSSSTTPKVMGFQLVFENEGSYVCYTNYDGTVAHGKSMTGRQQTDQTPSLCLMSGTWSATKVVAGPAHHTGGGLRAAGVR